MANQWNIGDVKISRIVESEGPWDGNFLLRDARQYPEGARLALPDVFR